VHKNKYNENPLYSILQQTKTDRGLDGPCDSEAVIVHR